MSNEIKAYYCSECRNSYALTKNEVCPQCGKNPLRENPYACLELLKRRRQAAKLNPQAEFNEEHNTEDYAQDDEPDAEYFEGDY